MASPRGKGEQQQEIKVGRRVRSFGTPNQLNQAQIEESTSRPNTARNCQVSSKIACFRYFSLSKPELEKVKIIQRAMRRFAMRRRFKTMITEYAKTKEGKKVKQRNNTLYEIYTTERDYCKNLDSLIQLFLNPLKVISKEPNSFITPEDVSNLFLNIEQIYNLNSNLLALITERLKDWPICSLMGDIFISMIPMMDIYLEYYLNYGNSIKTLERLSTNEEFKNFLKDVASNPSCIHPNTSYFLIMPIQRLPRYQLLLHSLKNLTAETHVDYDNISQALLQVSKIVENINNTKRNFETQLDVLNRIEGLDTLIPAELRSRTNRELIKEGPLNEMLLTSAKKKLKLFHVILFDDLLVRASFKKSSEGIGKKLVADSVEIYTKFYVYDTSTEDGAPFVFVPLLPIRRNDPTSMKIPNFFYFSTITPPEKDPWVRAIRKISEARHLTYTPPLAPIQSLNLLVKVIEAKNLRAADPNGLSDPYFKLEFRQSKKRSAVIPETLNPVWNEEICLPLLPNGHNDDRLEIQIWDKDPLTDDFLGSVIISFPFISHLAQPGTPIFEEWVDVRDKFKTEGQLLIRMEVAALQIEPPSRSPRNIFQSFKKASHDKIKKLSTSSSRLRQD
eukprot:TRINITY_DN4295_c0_g1_i2.p1 TRINITY_DN4295_c0_g1~~TRINITY_DN4295_c0_g1_i2.p1  ORF type:complete len:617 (-),score=123.68 TRINITY_DN4295_c0_g1_i2:37-1887(-)